MKGLVRFVELSSVRHETYPIRGGFKIARGAKTEAEVVVAELTGTLADGRRVRGRGECVPYGRYGETVRGVTATVEAQADIVAEGLDRNWLQSHLPPGAARNALDCAFWDLEAKAAGIPAWRLAGLSEPTPLTTAYTLSLDAPDAMGRAARDADAMPLLKLKLGGDDDDLARVAEVRRNAPGGRLIVDANESWTLARLEALAPRFAELGVALIEQPLPAGEDEALAGFASPVPLGADESCHTAASLPQLLGRYQVVNIKLDKAGGLTEALRLRTAARRAGVEIMAGCMVCTSLAVAPALLMAQGAAFVDLDGPILLERDRPNGLTFEGARILPLNSGFWG